MSRSRTPDSKAAQSATGLAQGWVPLQHVTVDAYSFAIDEQVKHSGAKSLRIARVAAEPFGSIVQSVSDATLRGRTVRFSAWLRTRDAATGSGAGGGALIVQALRGGALAAYEHMRASPVKGTTDWRQYSITLAIPADADAVEVGAMLVGPGNAVVRRREARDRSAVARDAPGLERDGDRVSSRRNRPPSSAVRIVRRNK